MGTAPPQLTGSQELPSLSRDPVVVAEATAAILAIVLAMTLVVAWDPDEPPASPSARRAPPAAAGTPAATTATGVVPYAPAVATAATRILPGGPGFESDPRPAGWQAVGGARVERVGAGREGRWAASVERGTSGRPGIALPRAGRLGPSRSSVRAVVWLRSSAPGTAVTLSLFELSGGGRRGLDTVRAVLDGSGWQRLATHKARGPGSWLGVEIVAPGLPGSANLLVDDLAIQPA
ncbi:MAG TPA: hypothetical protein VGM21_03280 [Actinomycetota bacterium]|jgi:hypothetical protein